ncbi:alpha/beta hydrolase [Pseudotenacibaculum sp. MALMAid0570]|uniref:alpha/beta fold hydrolase n=1 Tax=Pseudotenacibaculum sp. MALMAid0570 TaxID=3143938 RepID=UPI0032E032D3
MNSLDWKKLGNYHTIDGHQLFVIDTKKMQSTLAMHHEEYRKDFPVMVFLHGYPTSTFDYYKVFPELSEHYRLVMHDHLGFGFSDKPKDVSYSLMDQADRALELWQSLGLKKVTLFAHDYGTSVATEIIARHNAREIDLDIEQLILCNGSIHIELSQLRTIQKLLKHKFWGKYVAMLTNYPIFRKNMRNIYFDRSKVTDHELREMWNLLELNGGRKVIHKLTQYIAERYEYWDRWVGAIQYTQIPTKIIWAKNDPIAVPEIGELLASEIQNNELNWMENTGHFLMLENPKEWIKLILK